MYAMIHKISPREVIPTDWPFPTYSMFYIMHVAITIGYRFKCFNVTFNGLKTTTVTHMFTLLEKFHAAQLQFKQCHNKTIHDKP